MWGKGHLTVVVGCLIRSTTRIYSCGYAYLARREVGKGWCTRASDCERGPGFVSNFFVFSFSFSFVVVVVVTKMTVDMWSGRVQGSVTPANGVQWVDKPPENSRKAAWDLRVLLKIFFDKATCRLTWKNYQLSHSPMHIQSHSYIVKFWEAQLHLPALSCRYNIF